MATSLITRETAGAGAAVKNAPLTNEEVDLNFISITDNKLEAENNLSDLQNASNARSNLGVEIGVDVQSFDANTAKLDAATSNFTGTLQEGGNDVAVYADTVANFTGDLQVSGTSVLIDSDIGSTVQAFDANTAKLDATTSNFTGDLQVSGTSVLIDSDIGSTVQAFDLRPVRFDLTPMSTNSKDITALSGMQLVVDQRFRMRPPQRQTFIRHWQM
jgi:hypothetical protein